MATDYMKIMWPGGRIKGSFPEATIVLPDPIFFPRPIVIGEVKKGTED